MGRCCCSDYLALPLSPPTFSFSFAFHACTHPVPTLMSVVCISPRLTKIGISRVHIYRLNHAQAMFAQWYSKIVKAWFKQNNKKPTEGEVEALLQAACLLFPGLVRDFGNERNPYGTGWTRTVNIPNAPPAAKITSHAMLEFMRPSVTAISRMLEHCVRRLHMDGQAVSVSLLHRRDLYLVPQPVLRT